MRFLFLRYDAGQLKIMCVGGPNVRKDYHIDEGEEVRNYQFINPLSPNSDQHQFSPNNIQRLSSATSMRINQMITKRKISDLL